MTDTHATKLHTLLVCERQGSIKLEVMVKQLQNYGGYFYLSAFFSFFSCFLKACKLT